MNKWVPRTIAHGRGSDADTPAVRHHIPKLVITRGRGAGRDVAVGTQCLIGRAPGADLVLDDAGVSRRHARIALEGAAYVLHDLDSRNGMLVNGRRTQSWRLEDGDVIELGRIELLFRWRELVEEGSAARAAATILLGAHPAAAHETEGLDDLAAKAPPASASPGTRAPKPGRARST